MLIQLFLNNFRNFESRYPNRMIKKIYKKIIPTKQRILLLDFVKNLKSIPLRGGDYFCNICDQNFKTFLPAGVKARYRENAKCPKCGSLERNRFLWNYIQNKILPISKGKNIIHFAPENGIRKRLKNNRSIEYIAADKFSEYGDVVADLTALPFTDNYCDVIICSHILGHIEEEEKAFRELYRTLKPDGILILLTFINWEQEKTEIIDLGLTHEERILFYDQDQPLRIHGKDFEKTIQKGGIQYRNNLLYRRRKKSNTSQ